MKNKFTFAAYQRIKNRLKDRKRPKMLPLTFQRVTNSFAAQVFRMYSIKSGLMGSGFICVAGAAYMFMWGPYLENQYVRFALAGTMATVIVDFGLHGLDTLNMRSKALEGSKAFSQSLFRPQAFFSLFRGATSIVYGIAPSAALYFYFYP